MDDACGPVTVSGPDGTRLTACAHGGQLLGWIPAGQDRDLLWTSPLARCGPGLAVRGGVPVIFPQFSGQVLPGGPALPKHGLARDRVWSLRTGAVAATAPGPARIQARLMDDPATRELWPHPFRLELTATAAGAQLELALAVTNTGPDQFRFVAALHGYLRVSDAARARVHGLAGRPARDNTDGTSSPLPADPLPALGPRDVAVPGALARADGQVRLSDPDGTQLALTASGFEDLVFWNPGPEHGLADVPPGGAAGFVCLEAARLDPVTLAPGGSWLGVQTLLLLS